MSIEKKVYLKVIGIDGTTKILDLIGDSIDRLQRKQKETNNNSQKDSSLRSAIKDIERIEKDRLKWSKTVADEIARTDKVSGSNRVKEARKTANAVIAEIERIKKTNQESQKTAKDLFLGSFAGSSIGSVAGQAFGVLSSSLGSVYSLMKDLSVASVKLAGNFQVTTNALSVFTGSTRLAKEELGAVDDLARNSTGLRLESAQEGYLQLRALGFQAETSRKLLKGLAVQKIFSGADEGAIQRVIVNLIQLSNGSARASQDLKEMVQALPSLRNALQDAFGTLDYQKIAKMFSSTPDKSVEKLADAMSNGKTVAGGFNDSLGKLLDEITRLGRYSAEPVLEPLTKNIQEVTRDITDNRDVFLDWGNKVANVLTAISNIGETRLVSLTLALQNITERLALVGVTFGGSLGSDVGEFSEKIKGATDSLRTFYNYQQTGMTVDFKQIRESLLLRTKLTKNNQNAFRSDNTFNFDALRQPLSKKEQEAQKDGEQRRNEQAIEQNRQAFLENLKDVRERESSINSSFYATEESKLQSFLENTLADRLRTAKSVASVQKESIQSEISLQTRYYNDLLKFGNLSAADYVKTEREKNLTVFKLNNELTQNEYKNYKQIAEIERQIQDDRRKSLIEYKQLQIQQNQANLDNRSFDIGRSITLGTANAQTAYNDLIKITQESYQKISQLNIETYQEQLKNQSLTKEQRLNLTTQMYLDEQKLAEENRRKLLEIQDNQLESQLRKLDQYFQNVQNRYQSNINLFSEISNIFSPGNLSKSTAQSLGKTLFGGDFDNLSNDFETEIEKWKNIQKAFQDKANSGDSFSERSGFREEAQKAGMAVDGLIAKYKTFADSHSALSVEIFRLAKTFTAGTASINDFDLAQQKLLKGSQILELSKIDAEISKIIAQRDFAQKERQFDKVNELNQEIKNLSDEKTFVGLRQTADAQNLYNNSLKGLLETVANFRSGDFSTVLGAQSSAQKQIAGELIGLQRENILLQERIAAVGQDSAERYENAWLRAIYEVKDANIQAVEDQIRAQVQLENQMVRSNDIIRARVLDHLATQKTLNESIADGIINIYEKAATGLDKLIDKSGIGKIPILGDIAKANSRSFLTKITTGLLDKFLPSELADQFKKTGNPVVDEIKDSNKYLKTIADAVSGKSIGNIGGGSNGSASGGGGIFDIFKGIFGGSSGGGIFGGSRGIGGTAPFNPNINQLSGGGISTNTGGVRDFAGNIIGGGSNGSASGGIFGNLKNLFSTGEGGLFAPRKNILTGNTSKLAGIAGGAGSLVALAGGLIGGRAGGILSSVGTGVSIGASFGPWGALIGGGIGLIAGILGGDPKRKRDKNEKLPQLQSGFTDALAQLRQLVSDTKSLRVDPDSAISKATELRQAIASGFGIQFESKKYSKQSQSQISAKLSEADSIIAQIREAADIARTANARNNRILPEFSTGGYLPGAFDRKDDIIARLSRGEMVLNPSQMSRVKSMAGFDVFAHAGIPNYPKREAMPKFADGGMVSGFSSGNSAPNINLNLNLFERADGGFDAYLDSDQGQRKVAVTVNKLKKNKEIA